MLTPRFTTDGPLVEQAWQFVEVTYNRFVDIVADSRRGMLWRPVEKLYKKAKANRAARLAQKAGTSGMSEVFNPGSSEVAIHPTFADLQNPPSAPTQRDDLSGMQHLNVNEVDQDWNTEVPADMAWLDWATFAEDITDLNMIDPVDLTQFSAPGLSSPPTDHQPTWTGLS